MYIPMKGGEYIMKNNKIKVRCRYCNKKAYIDNYRFNYLIKTGQEYTCRTCALKLSHIKKRSGLDRDILEDCIYLNETEFHRYYHNFETPTEYFADRNGRVYSDISGRILKNGHTMKGYEIVNIFIDRKVHPVTVHKIVASIYCKDSYHKGYDVDHINGIKDDNRAENLEWVTRSENILRAFRTGLKVIKRGDENPSVKYNDASIHKFCKLMEDGNLLIDAAKEADIPRSYAYGLLNGSFNVRRDIISQYNITNAIYTHPQNRKTSTTIPTGSTLQANGSGSEAHG